MKKFITRILICAALVGAILAVFCAAVYGLTGGKYARYSYQKGFTYQIRALENRRCGPDPKVMLLGGSAMTFGVNMQLLREALGQSAYMLGVHASMGKSYVFETARRFVGEGDTVVYLFDKARRNDYGMPLIYQILDGEDDLMRDFFWRHPVLFTSTFPDECAHRVHEILLWKLHLGKGRPFDWGGVYHARAFDPMTGYMTYHRECKYVHGQEKPSYVLLPERIPADTIDILNELDAFCRSRGARLAIAFTPCVDEAIVPGEGGLGPVLAAYEAFLRRNLTAPVIAHLHEQICPYTMIYDRPRHLNDLGSADFTRRLARDIKAFQEPPDAQSRTDGLQ